MIALTMLDLYEAPPDLFVAGLAGGAKGAAVFSFARYDPRDSRIHGFGHISFNTLHINIFF